MLCMSWIERHEEMKQFRLKKGHCEVPKCFNDNPSLGMWLSNIRQQCKLIKERKQVSLTVEKIEELEAIGFTWQMKKLNIPVPCIERYEELKQFVLKTGHCEVASRYNDNLILGMWASNIRHE